MCGDAQRIGFYGFGAAAHIIAQVAVFEERELYAFTKPGDRAGQEFARSLGAVWAGGSDERPPELLDAAILFAPVGALVPAALRAVRKGGVVVCAGIHMSRIPAFPYEILWGERVVRSVANLTRRDGLEFFEIAPRVPVKTQVEVFALEQANEALDALRSGRVHGAAVLRVEAGFGLNVAAHRCSRTRVGGLSPKADSGNRRRGFASYRMTSRFPDAGGHHVAPPPDEALNNAARGAEPTS